MTARNLAVIGGLLHDWREDAFYFLRHDALRILIVVAGAYLLVRIVRLVTSKAVRLQGKRLPGVRSQQVRTLSSVITSVSIAVICFVALLQVLSVLGFNLGPLLASAGIAGLAIGFGAQALVKDVINGFFVLLEDQYDIGDTVRVAGVKGAVEDITLRRTVLRDEDGTLHMVPNGQITIVSNMTRDWAQLALRIAVAYHEPSEKVEKLLQEAGDEVRHDPRFADDIVSDVRVPGIDRVGNGEAEYLVLVKTRPNRQHEIIRELRRRIKDCFQRNNVQPGGPGKVYVIDQQERVT